ncbi:hypothetical protein [Sphingosinicella sp. CPCC 101087]|uniref:hypothetical protein n=1 Tax=Sphingosinicella sp. CPCC 101087 TaxID=2497754 RepID=UPI00101BE2E3|nr:hypothetical protein [Sphingosinicella sp. CPCC 101087]
MKSLAGLVAGLVAAVAAMIAVGFVGNLFVPLSDAPVPGETEAVTVALAAAPLGAQVTVLLAWFAAALAGAAAARFISRASWPGWTIAGLLALLLAGTFLVPLPIWMQTIAVLGPLAGGAIAQLLVPLRRGAPDAIAVNA